VGEQRASSVLPLDPVLDPVLLDRLEARAAARKSTPSTLLWFSRVPATDSVSVASTVSSKVEYLTSNRMGCSSALSTSSLDEFALASWYAVRSGGRRGATTSAQATRLGYE
jgi:hypothetical protein